MHITAAYGVDSAFLYGAQILGELIGLQELPLLCHIVSGILQNQNHVRITLYCIAVKEKGDDIVFLRKIIRGGADKSYGIQVAKLAGVPEPVIARAKELVEELSEADISLKPKALPVEMSMESEQISLFDTVKDDDIITEIRDMDLGNMTPLDALNTIYRLQNKIKNRW